MPPVREKQSGKTRHSLEQDNLPIANCPARRIAVKAVCAMLRNVHTTFKMASLGSWFL